jgi:hypothetical protein
MINMINKFYFIKVMKLLFVFVVVVVITPTVFPQSVADFYYKIDLKLLRDTKYLDLKYIEYQANSSEIKSLTRDLRDSIPRLNDRKFQFPTDRENVTYRFVFMKDTPGLEPLILLYIDQYTDRSMGGNQIFGGAGGINIDTERVLRFSSLYALRSSTNSANRSIYNRLLKLIKDYLVANDITNPPASLLGFDPDKDINVSIVPPARNNEDYLSFARRNLNDWFPPEEETGNKGRAGLIKRVETTSGSETGTTVPKPVDTSSISSNTPQINVSVNTTIDTTTTNVNTSQVQLRQTNETQNTINAFSSTDTPFKLDASLSSISFTHEAMNFGIGVAGVDFGVSDRVINLLPWQADVVTTGIRVLFSLSDDKVPLDDKFLIDFKIAARWKLNLRTLANAQPYLDADSAKLNIGTAAILDFHLTRPFGLPFINIYIASGGQAFGNPIFRLPNENPARDTTTAYFSFVQSEVSFSFYWNGDINRLTRFKMDVGAGYYDIWEAMYDGPGRSPFFKALVQDKFFPLLVLYFYLSPQGDDLFGAKIRYFDSQIRLDAWLKLLEFSKFHTIRFEANYLTAPFGRNPRPWEISSRSLFFQLRYRYGFNIQ